MDRSPEQQPRRLRALPTPTDLPRHTAPGADELDVELVRVPPLMASAASAPRDPALDALLREVDELRSTLRSDLTLAATAASAGESHLAAWLMSQEDERVAAFEERVLGHLATVELEPVATLARRRRVLMGPAAPIVAAAAAVIGFVIGVAPERATTSSPTTSNAAMESFADVSRLTSTDGSVAEVTAAADRLHAELATLVQTAADNPAAAEQALILLENETLLLSNSEDKARLTRVIAQAQRLVLQLRKALPSPPSVAVDVPKLPEREPSAEAKPSSPAAKPTTSPAARPSSQPSPSPSATRPSSSPSPSPSSGGGLPGAPGAGGGL